MNTVYPLLALVSLVLAGSSAIIGGLFVMTYRREPWRTFPAGRHLMRFTIGITLISAWSILALVLRYFVPEESSVQVVLYVGRIATFGWVTWMLWQHLRILKTEIRANHEQEQGNGRTDAPSR